MLNAITFGAVQADESSVASHSHHHRLLPFAPREIRTACTVLTRHARDITSTTRTAGVPHRIQTLPKPRVRRGDERSSMKGPREGRVTKPQRLAKQACVEPPASASAGTTKPVRRLSAFQEKLRRRLESGSFRQLNEQLYTTTSAEAHSLLRADPSLFTTYHAGYADQVRRWPFNPLDRAIAYLKTQPSSLNIADMGCGEARLATQVPQATVHSFDLVAANDSVIACDIAHTPLDDASVDIVIFCLSLMGTNYGDFVREARRIIRDHGTLLVAEVSSRFESDKREMFEAAVRAMGFRSIAQHPFVTGECGSAASQATAKSKRRNGRNSKQKSKHRVSTGPEADFFVLFAFQAVPSKTNARGANGNRAAAGVRSVKMPMLKACAYKKR